MKKIFLLALGLFVAGLAAWAVPREQKSDPIKISVQVVVTAYQDVDVKTFDLQPVISWAQLHQEISMPSIHADIEKPILTGYERWRGYKNLERLHTETNLFIASEPPPVLVRYSRQKMNC